MVKILLLAVMLSGVRAQAPSKAFLLSLVLPAAGHRYLGEQRASAWSLRAEVGLWAAYLGLRTWASWREEDAWAYAAAVAGARGDRDDRELWDAMGFYDNVHEYNLEVTWREGSSARTYPERPPTWDWPGEEERLRFKSLKDSSLRARHRARMVLWCIAGYHLTSALRALKVAGGSKVSAIPEPYGLRMVVVRRFR